VDTRDVASAHAEDSLDAAVESRMAWLNPALARLPPGTVDRFMKARPSLARYGPTIERARRGTHGALSEAEEALFQRMLPFATGWEFPLWQRLAPGAREPRSYVLIETVRARDFLARQHGYASAPDEAYASRYLTVPAVRALIALVRSKAGLYRAFLTLKARHAAQTDPPLTVPLDSVQLYLTRALSPLGAVYGRTLAALFDPPQERIDLGPGPNRQRGGFSAISPGRGSVVYLDGYAGALRDFSRLTHESAHAVHRQLMDEQRLLQADRDGPLLPEPVALMNELIAADYLYVHATDPASRRQALEQFLNKAFEVFLGAQDAELEQSIYDGVASGVVATADHLDSLTRVVDAAYTVSPPDGRRWMNTQLLVEDPLYLSNYLYSGMIVLAMYGEYAAAPTTFGPRYTRFLSSGIPGAPFDVVRRTLGIDLSRPDLLDRGLALLERRLAEFREAMDAK
jgi:oligoendopeptidase F